MAAAAAATITLLSASTLQTATRWCPSQLPALQPSTCSEGLRQGRTIQTPSWLLLSSLQQQQQSQCLVGDADSGGGVLGTHDKFSPRLLRRDWCLLLSFLIFDDIFRQSNTATRHDSMTIYNSFVVARFLTCVPLVLPI